MKQRLFYPYLDDFDLLTIIIPIKNYRNNLTFHLIGNGEVIDITIQETIHLSEEVKLICTFDAYIDLGKRYFVVNELEEQSELYTGKIVRTELFDNIYRYKKNDLGFTYTKESTKFKIWSPVAKYVKIELISPNNDKSIHSLAYTSSGVWRLVIDQDLNRYKYRYHIYVNGKEEVVLDPYAKSSDANATYNYVVDLNQTYSMQYTPSFSGNPLDAIIYEMHVRDFTIDPSIPFHNPGSYLGVVEEGLKTKQGNPVGIDYLKKIGITHVQMMPIFDFGGVDEINKDSLYNWGYNPVQYFVPEGWYSSNPNDPYARINECKQMIDILHKNNISVVMDVVYNHVYEAAKFAYEKLVPGYPYHFDREGMLTNVSGCNNDLATHRKMIRKLIIDSILYWVNEFKIDGFRFDLMGLIDVETMNDIRQELHAISDKIIVYGEGWKMYSSNQSENMAHMYNKHVLYTIGFFNDTFRDLIKGKTFDHQDRGFAMGNPIDQTKVSEVLLGSAYNRFLFKYTTQSINYVECHDNLTFFDKASLIEKDHDIIKKWQKLALSMVLLSQGVPFIHAGQEFYRTKHCVENSYCSLDNVNLIDWHKTDLYQEDIDFFISLIELRKKYLCFKLKSHSDLNQHAEVIKLNGGSVLLHLNDDGNFIMLFKPTNQEEYLVIPDEYELILSSGHKELTKEDNTYQIDELGMYLFQKKGSKS